MKCIIQAKNNKNIKKIALYPGSIGYKDNPEEVYEGEKEQVENENLINNDFQVKTRENNNNDQILDDYTDDILTDNTVEEDENNLVPEQMDIKELEEVPEEEKEVIPEFRNIEEALNWAINNKRVMKITYVTSGRSKSKGGIKLKRENGLPRVGGGRTIWRIVEPHYIFLAKNGNLILVTYDRSVRHIRAFIIKDNFGEYKIKDYEFSDKMFKNRKRINPRFMDLNNMDNFNVSNKIEKLTKDLNSKGFIKVAELVKKSEKSFHNLKLAQYVGVQGYWIRNRRCWDNCYRQKRSSSPDKPIQETWNECWDEYKKSINNDSKEWDKYAANSKEENIKLDKDEINLWNKKFSKKIENRVKKGSNLKDSVSYVIENESNKYINDLLKQSSNLMTIARELDVNGFKKLSQDMTDVSYGLLKEGGVWDSLKQVGRWLGNKITPSGLQKQKVLDKLFNISSQANNILSLIQRQTPNVNQQNMGNLQQLGQEALKNSPGAIAGGSGSIGSVSQTHTGVLPNATSTNIAQPGGETSYPVDLSSQSVNAIPSKVRRNTNLRRVKPNLPQSAQTQSISASVYNLKNNRKIIESQAPMYNQQQQQEIIDSYTQNVRQIIDDTRGTINELANAASYKDPQFRNMVDAALNNLQSVVQQSDIAMQRGQLDGKTLIQLLNNLSKASIEARRDMTRVFDNGFLNEQQQSEEEQSKSVDIESLKSQIMNLNNEEKNTLKEFLNTSTNEVPKTEIAPQKEIKSPQGKNPYVSQFQTGYEQ